MNGIVVFFVKQNCFLVGFILCSGLHAEVIIDASFSNQIKALQPYQGEYAISQDLGKTVGTNLFHSFQQFNLGNTETAAFSGNANIQNVISRVTGGSPSDIRGTIRNEIAGANTYLLNPAGVMFSGNAKWDVQGSFHVSTADYLKFADDKRLYTSTEQGSQFSSAAVSAFGFIDAQIAPVSIQGHGLISTDLSRLFFDYPQIAWQTGLGVPEGYDISLLAGDIRMWQGNQTLFGLVPLVSMAAERGHLYLGAFAAKGEVSLTPTGLNTTGFSALGRVDLLDKTSLSASGQNSDIFIHAGDVNIDNSFLNAGQINFHSILGLNNSVLSEHSPLVTQLPGLNISHGQAGGNVNIQANNMYLTNGAAIYTGVSEAGQGGDIHLQVKDNIVIQGAESLISFSGLYSLAVGENADAGDAGDIKISADQLLMDNFGWIISSSLGGGDAGDIDIQVRELEMLNFSSINSSTDLRAEKNLSSQPGNIIIKAENIRLGNSSIVNFVTSDNKKSNVINIHADYLNLDNQSHINSSLAAEAHGFGGNLILDIKQHLSLDNESNIISLAEQSTCGQSGQIQINAGQLSIKHDSLISTETMGQAHAGQINIMVDGELMMDQAIINNNSELALAGAGTAGNIQIQTQNLSLLNGAHIDSSANQAQGGNINIESKQQLYLHNGHIVTDVRGGNDNSGNIEISNTESVILNRGQITAQADAGRGGNINIGSQQFMRSTDSVISASSRMGIDGKIHIKSPDTTLNPMEALDLADFTEARLLASDCQAQSGSRFVSGSLDGSPLSPEDFFD
ncbi:two-partner secretion domain-containing protein [Candidatus Venteria ishoeyi]|uniref:Haemagglutination activity domain protein n=1 Tax=Candidatus Venteria ishoeyi TaxID=1899563 RepID=A0A1H6FHB1_9GAMM|nr:filamentous hemagglutinin N-terminal domain-containing protein [Candidatus Venteria ishoeyi]SEH08821.1 haemagglutination activity domain protein [Candidatus Venteria ishoeyi]